MSTQLLKLGKAQTGRARACFGGLALPEDKARGGQQQGPEIKGKGRTAAALQVTGARRQGGVACKQHRQLRQHLSLPRRGMPQKGVLSRNSRSGFALGSPCWPRPSPAPAKEQMLGVRQGKSAPERAWPDCSP